MHGMLSPLLPQHKVHRLTSNYPKILLIPESFHTDFCTGFRSSLKNSRWATLLKEVLLYPNGSVISTLHVSQQLLHEIIIGRFICPLPIKLQEGQQSVSSEEDIGIGRCYHVALKNRSSSHHILAMCLSWHLNFVICRVERARLRVNTQEIL